MTYAPTCRLDTEPPGRFAPRPVREAALRHSLRGVDLGAYDEKIITWAVGMLDDATARTMVSLIERARQAER